MLTLTSPQERKGNPDETPYAGYEQADDHGDSSTSSGGCSSSYVPLHTSADLCTQLWREQVWRLVRERQPGCVASWPPCKSTIPRERRTGVDPGSFADAKPKESQSSNPPTRIGSTASLMDLPQGMDYSELRVMTGSSRPPSASITDDVLSQTTKRIDCLNRFAMPLWRSSMPRTARRASISALEREGDVTLDLFMN